MSLVANVAHEKLWSRSMLSAGAIAPDFTVGDHSLYEMLDKRTVVVFFFPRTFTSG